MNRMRALGLDIGGTSVKGVLIGEGGQLAVACSARYARPDRARLVLALREVIREIGLNAQLKDASGPDVVGLCVPGRRSAEGNTVLASANVPGLVGHPLDRLVAEALAGEGSRSAPCPPPVVTSDAHAAALDIAGTLSPVTDAPHRLLAISMGTGVGACVLDGDRPLHVSGSSPGHIGQIDLSIPLADGSFPVGPDGGRGGLEAYVGLPALLDRLGPPVDTIADRLEPGDPALLAVARTIRIGHALYRPHTVALLGGLGAGLSPLERTIRGLVDDGLTSLARTGWRLVFGTDGFHAARGVASLAARAARLAPRAATGAGGCSANPVRVPSTNHFLCVLRARETFLADRTPEEALTIAAHFDYLASLTRDGRVLLAGRCQDSPPVGIVVLQEDDERAARELVAADPAVAAGLFEAEIRPFRIAMADVPKVPPAPEASPADAGSRKPGRLDRE